MCAISATLAGCVRLYTLPDAPTESEWVHAEGAQESPEEATRRFLEAKRAAIQCFAALADGKWEKALGWMSQQTKRFFASHSNGGEAIDVFEKKSIWIDGEELAFDPVGDVFIGDLVDIRDEFGGRKDKEDEKRRVLYAVSASGKARALVFVYEEDKWRLDLNDFELALLTE